MFDGKDGKCLRERRKMFGRSPTRRMFGARRKMFGDSQPVDSQPVKTANPSR